MTLIPRALKRFLTKKPLTSGLCEQCNDEAMVHCLQYRRLEIVSLLAMTAAHSFIQRFVYHYPAGALPALTYINETVRRPTPSRRCFPGAH